jgi:hypothetical protein
MLPSSFKISTQPGKLSNTVLGGRSLRFGRVNRSEHRLAAGEHVIVNFSLIKS